MNVPQRDRCILLTLLLVAGFSGLSLRLVHVQYLRHAELSERAERDYSRQVTIPSQRGVLFDRNGEQLSHNMPVFNLIADRVQMSDPHIMRRAMSSWGGDYAKMLAAAGDTEEMFGIYRREVARIVGHLLDLPEGEAQARLDFGSRMEVILQRDMPEKEMRYVRERLDALRIGGLRFDRSTRRFYPGENALSHVLGYVDHSGRGMEGVEHTMNGWLSGEDGYRFIQIDRRGREIPAFRGEEKAARDGSNVHLTVDLGLQALVERELAVAMEEFQIEQLSAILMDPFTGDIVAMANLPDFNPNTRVGQRRNAAVSDLIEPGSTFKVVAVAAALDLGLVNLETLINCHNGYYSEGSLWIRDIGSYGMMSVAQVVAKSSNIGTYKIARIVGQERFFEYVERFGFGRRTGVALTAEGVGNVQDSGNRIDFSRVSYGYAVSLTPLQLASAYCTLANGGTRMRPRLVRQVSDKDGNVIMSNPPVAEERVLQARTAAMMRRAMQGVVHPEGTGRRAEVPGYSAAGKTGTANMIDPETGHYDKQRNVVSFAGFLPAEDPQLVCVIIASDPKPGDGVRAFGGTVAAPIFSRIGSRAMAYLDVPPSLPIDDEEEAELLDLARSDD